MLNADSFFSKNWLVYKISNRHLKLAAKEYACGKLLDIGCGEKPLRSMFAPYVTEHIGLDHQDSLHSKDNVDIFGSAYEIPKENECFDTVLCTAVLEHLEEPAKAIAEANRVLKKGGIAIYTVPFFWHLHEEPRDFYRYTKYGLKYLFEKNAFEIVEIKALSGFWVTFGQLFVYNIYRFNRGPLKYIPIIPAVGLVIQGISYLLDRLDTTEQWTWMYMIVVKKI